MNLDLAAQAAENADHIYRQARWLQLGLGLVGLVGGLGLAWLIRRSIAGPLQRVIDSLSEASSQLAAASSQIASASHGLAQGSSQQAAAVSRPAPPWRRWRP